MNDTEAAEFLLRCLEKSGIPVVTDPQTMAEALNGTSFADAAKRAVIQREVLTYAEGEREPDLTPTTITIKDKNGNDVPMYSVKFYGDRAKGYVPKTVGTAYKLMEQWPNGTLHALFAGANKRTYRLGEWNWAEGFSRDESKGQLAQGLAPRYGWHMGTGVPSAPQLMGIGSPLNPTFCYPSKHESGHPKGSRRVWVLCQYDATRDYTPIAEANPDPSEKDIRGLVPFGGYYMFQESNLSNWIVASSIRLVRILPEEERQELMKNAGYNEELVWRTRTVRSKLKAARTGYLRKLQKTGNTALLPKLSIINQNEIENETRIQKLSHGKLFTYPLHDYQKIGNWYTSLATHDFSPRQIADEATKILATFSDIAKKHKAELARQKLSLGEAHDVQQEIRSELLPNADYYDALSFRELLASNHGTAAGFVKDGTIYLDLAQIDPRTPIHEYTHVWDAMLKETQPALWQEGVALMKQTKLWNAVKESPAYRDIADDDDLIASEVHARLTAEHGATLLKEAKEPKGLIQRLTKWQNKFWKTLQRTIARATGKNNLYRMELGAFLQAPMADLVQGKRLIPHLQR